ncbi:TonB-dependent receptor [Sphingomonas bacterium]|uniref:TonB-dependent receptor n=1 Tax=Sphingomonas bacterium TaxID=1895847 RepID=UPI0015771007|nr:TonB-dependent receptor [Sphingomonas bacterium]
MLNRFGAGASVICLVLATPVWSQASPPPAATGTSDKARDTTAPGDSASQTAVDQGGLQDIIVTAQKRSENLQRVPISITAVDGAALTDKSVGSTAEIGTVAAGVNVRINNTSFLPYIRGIGTNSSNTESPASLYVDGVYIPYSRAGLRDLNDIAQLAVLKGPQGTLFGRNSTAGVIQITTRDPSQELHAETGGSIDNYETARGDIYVAGGLADGLAASFSGQYGKQFIGWGKDYTTGNYTHRLDRDVSLRGKVVFKPGPDTKITLIGEYYDQNYVGIAKIPYAGTTLAYRGVSGPVQTEYDHYGDTDGFLRNKGYLASATIDQQIGRYDFRSITSYQNSYSTLLFDNDLTAAPAFTVSGNQPNRAVTQELQLASPTAGVFKWVVGGYYFSNHERSDPSVLTMRPPVTPLPALFIRRDGQQSTESLAGFAEGTLTPVEGTSLTLGARYTWERRDFVGVQTTGVIFFPNVPGPLVAQTQTVRKPSFRVALDHEFGSAILGYLSFNTGFKSGGYNLLAPTSAPYLPESLRAYEAGLKTQLFDRRLRLNGAFFYYDYSNIQVSQVVNNISTVSNAAKAETYGLDVDLQALITHDLQISGALAVLHAQYTDYPGAQLATPKATGGATITSFNAAGNRLPSSQKFSANLALDYDRPVAGATMHFNVTGAYQGDYFLEPDNYIRQPSYVNLSTSLKVTLPGDHFSVTLFGKNLFDARVITAASATATVVSVVYDVAPRTYGAAFRYKF